MHSHIDHTRGPNMYGSGIEFFIDVFFESDIRSGSTESRDHVCTSFPGHTKTFTITKFGNFQGATSSKKEILRLEISVDYSHLMHISNAAHHLLEIAVSLIDLKFACGKDEGAEVSTSTEFHHFIVISFRILEGFKCVDNIWMSQ
jgi:hypothetical protein